MNKKWSQETARKEYQLFRQGNYDKYITTDIFEEHGLIKYVNLSFDIVASVGQVVGGVGALKFGKVVHSNRIKGIGVTLVAHGANNFYESLSPLFFNEYDSGPIRELYRVIAKKWEVILILLIMHTASWTFRLLHMVDIQA